MSAVQVAEGVFIGVVSAQVLMGFIVPYVLGFKSRKARKNAMAKLVAFENMARKMRQQEQEASQARQGADVGQVKP